MVIDFAEALGGFRFRGSGVRISPSAPLRDADGRGSSWRGVGGDIHDDLPILLSQQLLDAGEDAVERLRFTKAVVATPGWMLSRPAHC